MARLANEIPVGGELTSAGQAMGTADFMAPEQITDSHSVDIRADIYSLGCTLYKLLTGEAPFPGPKYKNMLEKMTGHLRDTPRPMGELRSDVPAGLVAVVQQMMAKDRAARYATPREVAAALAPFAAGANLDHLARCTAAADAGQPLPPLPTEPYLSCPMTGTSSSAVYPGSREPDEEDVPWNLPNDAPPPAIFPFDAAQARRHQEAWAKYLGVPVEQTNSLGMKFALVPPGEFEFPFTKEGQTELTPDTPRERLRLVRPIYVGTTEVTFAQFQKFVDATGYQTDAERIGGGKVPPDWKPNPEATWKNPWQRVPALDEPVTQVSANDAMAFCEWLTILECGDLSPLSKSEADSSGPGTREEAVAQGGPLQSGDKAPPLSS